MNFKVNLTSSWGPVHLHASECLRAAVHVTCGPALPRNDQMVCSPFKLYFDFSNPQRIPTAITSAAQNAHASPDDASLPAVGSSAQTHISNTTNTLRGVWGDFNTIHETVQPCDACFLWHHRTQLQTHLQYNVIKEVSIDIILIPTTAFKRLSYKKRAKWYFKDSYFKVKCIISSPLNTAKMNSENCNKNLTVRCRQCLFITQIKAIKSHIRVICASNSIWIILRSYTGSALLLLVITLNLTFTNYW